MSQTDTTPTRILRLPAVRERLGNINPSTIWRWEQDPKIAFPKRIKIGPNVTGWREDQVNAWLERRTGR